MSLEALGIVYTEKILVHKNFNDALWGVVHGSEKGDAPATRRFNQRKLFILGHLIFEEMASGYPNTSHIIFRMGPEEHWDVFGYQKKTTVYILVNLHRIHFQQTVKKTLKNKGGCFLDFFCRGGSPFTKNLHAIRSGYQVHLGGRYHPRAKVFPKNATHVWLIILYILVHCMLSKDVWYLSTNCYTCMVWYNSVYLQVTKHDIMASQPTPP